MVFMVNYSTQTMVIVFSYQLLVSFLTIVLTMMICVFIG